MTIKFVAKVWLAGGVYDVRLMKRNLTTPTAAVHTETARNPIIWADVPDIAMIRVGDTYYMSSTTHAHESRLADYEVEGFSELGAGGYAYDTLGDNDALTLQNGKNAYGAGSWASSLRFTTALFTPRRFPAPSARRTFIPPKTSKKARGKRFRFRPSLHDHSLFFDDDGRVYMLYGGGDLRLTELNADLIRHQAGRFQ